MELRRYEGQLELDVVVAEREFPLFKRDGTRVPVTVRIGKPFKAEKFGDYLCPLQVLSLGKGPVRGAWGEDSFVALQHAMDLAGKVLDDLVKRENLETRFRASGPHNLAGVTWIWRYPVRDFEPGVTAE
jgi:hypothetical protein